jgi:hypothetical protein
MRTYTKREIAHLLKVSVRTVEDDARFLNLSPSQGDRGQNLYNQYDYNLIRQVRQHCADKTNTRDSFVPSTEVEIIESDSLAVTRMPQPQPGGIELYRESLELGMSQDPLFDLELLQRISDRQWLLPAARLAPILGISPKYLNSKKHYDYCGFVASKEISANNRILWKLHANNH